MILEPWILESIDQAAQEALVLPESERERHYLRKASELQREALIAGRSLQEAQDIGSTFVDGTRVLVRYRHISARHRPRSRRKSTEHRKLMQAAIRRDVDTAIALMTAHVQRTQQSVQAALTHLTTET